MKTLLFFNKAKYDMIVNQIDSAKVPLENLLKEFYELNLFKLKSISEFQELVTGSETFIKRRIGEEIPVQNFGIFKLRKRAAVDLLDLPSFDRITQLAAEAQPFLPYLRYFVIYGETLQLDKPQLDSVRESLTLYTEHKGTAKLNEAYIQAAKSLERFNEALISQGLGMDRHELFNSYFEIDSAGSVKVAEDFFLRNWGKLQPVEQEQPA